MAAQQQHTQSSGRKMSESSVGSARGMIEDSVGQENIDAFLSMLQPIGDFSIKTFRTTFGYARRHPVRIAMSVIAIGLVSSWLASSKRSGYLH